MKRCPRCYQGYENTAVFCEADGQRLLNDPALLGSEENLVPDFPSKSNNRYFVIGLVGVLTGVLLCSFAYIGYLLLKPEPDPAAGERRPFAQVRDTDEPRPAPPRTAEAAPAPSESPSPEPDESASPEPSQQPPTETVSARLSHGPVSTAEQPADTVDGVKTKTIIEMQDGSVIEVDAAWKDPQGVWYRRGSMVSFVDTTRVKAITSRPEPKAAPPSNP
jgi:hypothetical protein